MNRRALSILLAGIMLVSVISFGTIATPTNTAPADPATEICTGGTAGTPLVTCTRDGQDAHIAQNIMDAICALHPAHCADRLLSGTGGIAATDLDAAFADLQRLVIDTAFQTLALDLATVGLTFAPATDGNGVIVDQDGDGSADAWVLTLDGSSEALVPSDLVHGPLSGGQGMFPTLSASDDAPDGEDGGGGGGGGGDGQSVGPITITESGDQTYINITDPQDETDVLVTITIDPTAAPGGIGRNRVVVIDFHGNAPKQSMPGFSLYWAPFDFNYLVVSDPNDIDGDGNVTGNEHFTGGGNGHLFSNPVNGASIPGDADGDGCPFNHPGEDDTDSRIDPCTILPYGIDLKSLGAALGNPDNIVWNVIDAVFEIENITGTSFSEEESEIVSWEIWWADANSNTAGRNTICDDETHGPIEVINGLAELTCDWDSNEAKDTHDYLTAPPNPVRVDNYWAFFEICLAVDVPCLKTTDGLDFIVQNLPSLKYVSVKDNLTDEPDREGKFSGLVNFTLESEHPGFDITEFQVQARSVAGFDTAGQTAGGLGGSPTSEWIVVGNFTVDNPLVHRLKNETGDLTDEYTIVLDTAHGDFPKADAPRDKRAPRGELEPVPFMQGLEQNWESRGNQFRAVAKHADGDERMGQIEQQSTSPFTDEANKIFNNRPPEVSEFAIDILDTNGPVIEFQFHYYDPDGTPTGDTEVQVFRQDTGAVVATVPCVQLAANALDDLGTGVISWMDHPADFACEWEVSNVPSGIDEFAWRALVQDADGGDDPVETLADILVNLANQPPLLSGGSVDLATLPNPLANGTTYTFRVHYEDQTDPAGHVNVTLERVDQPADIRRVDMSPCLDDLVNAPPLGDGTSVDYCVDVVLPLESTWSYAFNATDTNGATATPVPPRAELEVPDVLCDHCTSSGEQAESGQILFNSTITDLNAEGVPMPVSGHIINDGTGEVFGPTTIDGDGDFVPDLIEHMLFGFDVFTVDEESETATFNNEWVIEIKQPAGGGAPGIPVLIITINGQDDSSFFTLSACSSADECLLESQDLSLIDLATTPAGLTMVGYDPDQVAVFHLVIDAAKLGSVQDGFVNITVAGTFIEVMSNPMDVVVDGEALYGPEEGQTTFGLDRDASGGLILYIDPNGDGEDRIESGSVDPSAVDPNDFLGPVDADGDGYPDELEPIYCSTVGTSLGGSCQNGDFTPA